ncbi:MAG: 4,5-DOPA dioxygenase extradiol [Bdellovibrionota bacterium]
MNKQLQMPVLFLGHGSPMNALAQNSFTQTLSGMAHAMPRPQSIVVISAHWETQGTWVTGMPQPKTIHDFYGFPKELFEIRYPAPGNPILAQAIVSKNPDDQIDVDLESWGLDHGAWSVLRHMYPQADIPVIQMSLDRAKTPKDHFELGKKLRFLREQGVLIVGSGNVVHNLKEIQWDESAEPWKWAVEFDEWIRDQVKNRDFVSLIQHPRDEDQGKKSIPTWEHYLPLLYVVGASQDSDPLAFPYEGIDHASISMRCIRFGA